MHFILHFPKVLILIDFYFFFQSFYILLYQITCKFFLMSSIFIKASILCYKIDYAIILHLPRVLMLIDYFNNFVALHRH